MELGDQGSLIISFGFSSWFWQWQWWRQEWCGCGAWFCVQKIMPLLIWLQFEAKCDSHELQKVQFPRTAIWKCNSQELPEKWECVGGSPLLTRVGRPLRSQHWIQVFRSNSTRYHQNQIQPAGHANPEWFYDVWEILMKFVGVIKKEIFLYMIIDQVICTSIP